MSLLGVDLGTSGVRVVAVDRDGLDIAGAARPTALVRPGDGLVETDADEMLAAAGGLLAEVASHPALAVDPPEAISFSVQGEAVVPVGSDGRALARAPVSMDRRGAGAAARIADELGARTIQRITGQPAHPMFSLYKLFGWTRPELHGYRCLGDYVAGRFGARAAMDTSMAARTGAYDVDAGAWSPELLAAAEVDERLLPEVVPAGTVAGKLSGEAAALTGLPSGLPLVVGAHDQAASFLGGGGRAGTSCVVSFGSSDCLTVGTSGRPRELIETGLATYPMREGLWLTLAGTAAGGWVLDWFAAVAGALGPAERDDLFEHAAADPPRVLVLPYFTGSGTLDNDPLARGAIVGLSLGTSRAELARAFLESFGFEIRKIVDALIDRDVAVGTLYAVGGGARSTRSLAIRASAAGRSLTPVAGHAAARGAALLAGVGIGLYPSIGDLPAPACGSPVPPDPATAEWYLAQARRFRDLYPTLVPHDRSYTETKELR
jgi:sugar (pentulose or hexulose) kinase